jgi:hypothetical protein
MRIIGIVLPVAALLTGAPAAAQSFQPAVVSTRLPPLEALWHLRVALNVAALGCRDADEANTVASYNALIRNQSGVLAAANDAVSAHYKADYGSTWETARERDMTRLYNYFAQPTAQAEFCTVAKDTLARVGSVEAQDLPGFALAALPQLEEPFWPQASANDYAAAPATSTGPIVAITAIVPVAPGFNGH